MSLCLAVASHKGGVGKSTISLNLAVAFAQAGYETVLVDTDPQGALNLALAKGHHEFPGLAEWLWQQADPKSLLLQSQLPQLRLLTKGRLAMKDIPAYEQLLFHQNALAPIVETLQQQHAIVMIDTPAGMGMVTRAVLRIASHVLVPFKVDTFNLRSLNQVFQVIDMVKQEENPNLNYLGIVLNMFERSDERSFRIAGEVWQDVPRVLDTTIPQAEIFARALELGTPLAMIGRRKHPEAGRFTALADEIISLVNPLEEDDEQVRQLL